MDLNLVDIIWAMVQISLGFGAAGYFLGKAMRKNAAMKAMHPANRSIATHQVMRVMNVSWHVALVIGALAWFFFSALYYPSDRLRSPIPWDTIGMAMTIYSTSLIIVRLATLQWHINFQEVLAITAMVSITVALGASMPGLLVGLIIILIIAWKIIGSRGYADGVLLRDYMIDNARDYYGHRARRR